MRKVAFFDMDGTIGRDQQIVNFVHLLFEQGLYPLELRDNIDKTYSHWKNRTGTFSSFINAVVEVFYQNVKDQSYDKFCELADINAESHWKQTYNFTRKLIENLQKAGYFLVLISHAPKFIVRPFAKKYGFNKVYGRFLEIDADRKFTGQIINDEAIADKAKIVEQVMKKYNLDFDGSVAVGDSHGDISMLSSVQRPLCMNPNSKLLACAQERGWPMVVERKDVSFVVMSNQEELHRNLLNCILN